jgi:hypothetical protein
MAMFHDTPDENDETGLHTREELMDFLTTKVTRPEPLTHDTYVALNDADRIAYNDARIEYMNCAILINTPMLAKAKNATNKSFAKNYGRKSGNRGLIVSGASSLGKTTIMIAIMQWTHAMYRRKNPNFVAQGKTPIVYVEVPSGSTGKSLMIAFAWYFGITVASRSDTMDTIQRRVVSAMKAANTQLVIVDELHNLSATNRGNGESIQILKSLHDMVPATFVYAGIDLDESELFHGALGRQISARFSEIKLTRYNLSNRDHAEQWKGLVQSFERQLPLAHHKVGSLVKLAPYLHDRTNGSIGSLGDLLVGSAIDIFLDPECPQEVITKELLDQQLIDKAAEDYYAEVLIQKAKSKRSE